ncbi:MAG: autoinducer binding domain-containing protein [Burkholderiales bacterium]|nr:autoinducer binding domain-containing protein [Burkholderiales bacterium]
MSLQQFVDIAQAPDVESFRRQLVAFAHERDFGLVSASLIVELPGRTVPPEIFFVSNTPQAFLNSAVSVEESRRDPVMKRMKALSVPFVYDQEMYVQEDAGSLWEHQAQFGYRTGIAVALHLPNSRHFLMGVDREHALPRSDVKRVRLMADLQLLAVHAQEAASRLFTPLSHQVTPRLTAREIEILRWTSEGKSAWAVGEIMGVSEHTVNFHLRSIFRKLDASSKHQAVIKALSFGLI